MEKEEGKPNLILMLSCKDIEFIKLTVETQHLIHIGISVYPRDRAVQRTKPRVPAVYR